MSAIAEEKQIVAGGSFLIEARTPAEVFTPEDFNEEHRIARFEFPVLMYFLAKVGVVTPEFLVQNRKYAVLAAFVISAILTPPDVFSQVLLALPLFLLFEVSIFVAKRVVSEQETADGPDQDE